ncbi:MAG: RNA polymerase sigma factor [Anaerolineales bacterium]|jgi:RNA polymerase sigma-70 factor (ECF subfamily)
MSSPDEASLVEQARTDPQAFAKLYNRFVERVFLFVLRRTGDRALAEDLTSATFEKALRHLRQYGWRGKNYLAWLYRIAHQQIIQNHRREKRYASLPPNQPAGGDVEAQVQSRQQWQTILRAFHKLSKRDQEVLALRLFDRYSNAETAEYMNCSPQNVSVRLYRALKHLRQKLEALGEYYGDVNHGTEK